MSTILFLSGTSANDALGAGGRAHKGLFVGLGYDFVEINLSRPGCLEEMNRVIQTQPIEFVFGVMGGGADITGTAPDGSKTNFWGAIGVPFLSLKGDTPAYFFDRHVMPSPWHACLYFHPEHRDFRQRLPRVAGLLGVVPPIPFDMTDKGAIDFRRKKSGKLLFLKNGNDPEKLVRGWRGAMRPELFIALTEIAGDLAGRIGSEAAPDVDLTVRAYFLAKGWDVDAVTNLRLFFVAQLDDYLRRVKSTLMGEALADLPVEIHGLNWEHVDFSNRRATFVPGGDYTRSKDEIREALGVIDMSPNTERAPHERAMRAFGLYTLCVTNQQRFFGEQFGEAADLFSFRFEKEHLRHRIEEVLANPKRHIELGIEVAEQFRKKHQPMDFAQYMIDTAGLIRLACGSRPAGLQDFFGWPPEKLAERAPAA